MRVILTATVMSLPPGAAAARDDTNAKLVVGYVAAVSARELVIVLATDGSPGQRKGMQIRFTLTPETRVFEFERPATMGAIVVRREVTVTYDDAKGANVAREVRVLDMLPPRRGDARRSRRRLCGGAPGGRAVAGPEQLTLAARFGSQRVTWDGEVKGLVAQEGKGVFLEIGFPQQRLRLRDGSVAFIGFVVNTAGTHIKTTDSKAVPALRISASVLPAGVTTNVPDLVRVSFVLKRVWIQPPTHARIRSWAPIPSS